MSGSSKVRRGRGRDRGVEGEWGETDNGERRPLGWDLREGDPSEGPGGEGVFGTNVPCVPRTHFPRRDGESNSFVEKVISDKVDAGYPPLDTVDGPLCRKRRSNVKLVDVQSFAGGTSPGVPVVGETQNSILQGSFRDDRGTQRGRKEGETTQTNSVVYLRHSLDTQTSDL